MSVATAGAIPSPARRAVLLSLLLGVTQTIGYGTLYYAFGVLAPAMSADTGYSIAAVYGLFSLAMVAGGVLAPRFGRLFDKYPPTLVMAAGSLLSALALAGWALAPGKAAFAAFIVTTEAVSILVLYEAAFASVAHLVPREHARRVITGITFVAGFASTIFWPATQYLLAQSDWRTVYLAYAMLHLAVCLPLHILIWRIYPRLSSDSAEQETLPEAAAAQAQTRAALRGRIMIWMLAGFAANAFVISAVHLHLIGLLGGLGLSASAALIGALIGPFQVAARVMEFATARRVSIHAASMVAAWALPLGLAVLVFGAPALLPALVFAAVFGAGQGLSYIVRGVLPLELFGREGYGALSGRIGSVRLFVSAAAPFITALLFERGGAQLALWAILAVALVSALALARVTLLVKGR